jgi:hypothetical protein
MYRASLVAAALTCVLLSACGDQTAPIAGPQDPDLRTSQNPDGPGAQVGGGEVPFTFLFSDPERGLGIIAGVTPENLAGFCADEDVERGSSVVHDVIRPDGSIASHEKAKQVSTMVFLLSGDAALCDGSAPFAVGTGNFTLHDNDFFVSGNRTNSFGFRVNGQVTDVNGERHHVSAAFQGIANRRGDVRIVKAGIVLH